VTAARADARSSRPDTIATFLERPVLEVARLLPGWTLLVDGVGGVIVETEAYRQDDPASHSFRGPTARTTVMFGPPGRLYVYRSYGVHWCANVVCEAEGRGAAVLLRALRPTHGLEAMRLRRGVDDDRRLCSGPGKLTQALGLSGAADGADLGRLPFTLAAPGEPPGVAVTTRIGISRAVDRPWRFVVRDSPWASRRVSGR
jgi:DNA-3-methyladenine glycosylase